MAGSPLQITLARSFAEQGAHFRVLAQPFATATAANDAAGHEIGSIELNRRIELRSGERFAIERRGRFFAPTHVLLAAARTAADAPALAMVRRERAGWWWQSTLTVSGATEQRYLLHRRAVFGSPANADVLSEDASGAATLDLAKLRVVLRVEKSGAWRQRLQARWLDSSRLSLPVVLFVLNILADQDRRAAIAASAGVAGV